MTMKRMKHPQHGFHHPLSGGELATMLANGWTHDDAPDLPKTHSANEKSDDSALAAPPLTRDELKTKADALGLSYPRNITTDKLAELIAAQP